MTEKIMENIHVYNTIEHTFNGIRCFDKHLFPVTWEIVVKLAGKSFGNVSEEEKEAQLMDITVSYQKIKWWLQTYINDVFVGSMNDSDSIEFFFGADYDNIYISTPYEPTDSILTETMFKKISVLAGKSLHIIQVSLRSSDFESTFYFSDKSGYQIPMDNEVYNGSALFELPWWCREDCDTWEPMKADGVSAEDLRNAIETGTELKEVGESIMEATFGIKGEDEEEVDDEMKSTSIIAMNELWQPNKVD